MTGTDSSSIRSGVSSLAALLCLAGCGGGGGGGGGGPPPPVQTPNTAPVASASNYSTQEDSPVSGTISAQDAEGNTLTYSVSQSPAHGVVTINASSGGFVYTPFTDFSGNDEFTFTASDGRLVSAPARVTIAVSAVNDAPVIQNFQARLFGEARQLISVALQTIDPEGSSVRIEVEPIGGGTVAEFAVRAGGFEFRLPDTTEVREVGYRLRLQDADGLVTEREFTATLCPVSASGRLTTIVGSPNSPGLHWVVTGDGFLASQRADLLQRAGSIVEYTLSNPALVRHRSAWNVHVLSVASAEAGADVPSQSIVRDTAFDATFDCLNITRLLCVNFGKVEAQVVPEFGDYDALLVIVNSQLYGGSGGFEGAVVSSHPSASMVMIHEMGHSFAGLADEYVDPVAAAQYAGSFLEGLYPNITRLSDVGQVPWRHWFANPNQVPTTPGATGIGLFEGGYYVASGYYRPSDVSFMRSIEGPVPAVHAEAWLRALYRRANPVVALTPTQAALTLAPEERRAFGITRPFGAADVQSVRWYFDGQELPAARNSDQLTCCTAILGTHTLRVDVADITGAIRAPTATEDRISFSWSVFIDANLPPVVTAPPVVAKADRQSESIALIRMRVDSSGHHVEGISRAQRPKIARDGRRSGHAGAESFGFTVTNAAGDTLASGAVADPRMLRGPMPLPGEAQTGHAVAREATGFYVIRVPWTDALRYLSVEPQAATPAARQAKARAGDARVIDLASFLPR